LDYKKFFQNKLEQIRSEGRYRIFRVIERRADLFPEAFYHGPEGTKRVTIWCSNDYLGLGLSHDAINACKEAASTFGVGAGGTRNISGTTPFHQSLENNLAALHRKEAALLFTSGYIANEGALGTLASLLPQSIIFSDAANHASLISGIRYSQAEKKIFPHNDWRHLQALLSSEPLERPKIIVAESVYSMDGTIAPLREFVELAEEHQALLYIDEVHAVGLYGNQGGGKAQELGLENRIPILQGTLGKAIGTMGGYVTSSREIIDLLRSSAPGFIFTTSLPPAIAAAALKNVQKIQKEKSLREAHQEIVEKTKRLLLKVGLPILTSPSHIIPFMVGNARLCQEMGEILLKEKGIYLQPINYPTVPKGEERFRITPSCLHTIEMAEKLAESLRDVWGNLRKIRKSVGPVGLEPTTAPL
jgi:5-aminolevulinate synthase